MSEPTAADCDAAAGVFYAMRAVVDLCEARDAVHDVLLIAQAIADERERIGHFLAMLDLDLNSVMVPKEKQS